MKTRRSLRALALLLAASSTVACRRTRAASPPIAVTWAQNAVAYRGRVGTQVTVLCPPGPAAGRVWGTDVYSDDSSICLAALHSGRVTPMGGAVAIQIVAGAPAYIGSLRNNVRSDAYGPWAGSFTIVGGALPGLVAVPLGVAPTAAVAMPTAPVAATAATQLRTFPPPPPNAIAAPPDPNPWGFTAHAWSSELGAVITMSCPPGGTPSSLWGTDIYTADSSICSAGVHAGAITAAAGGTVTIYMRPGQPIYLGSERNGVRSTEYASFGASFTLDPAVTESIAVPAGTTPRHWGAGVGGVLDDEHRSARVFCPPGGHPEAIWGSNPYTSDSTVCTAGVHAGVITLAAGGVFTVTSGEGLPDFPASERNGITSSGYGAYPSSFRVSP